MTDSRLHTAACALLLELAHADDEFSEIEHAHIEAVLRRHFRLDEEAALTLMAEADAERRQADGVRGFAERIRTSYDPGQRALLAEIMWGLILADGEIARHEAYLLRRIADLLELEPGHLATIGSLRFRPIGTVRSPFSDTSDIPKGLGAEHHAEGVLEIRPELEAGLTDIEGFSHLFVIWVFHQAGPPDDLVSRPPTDDRPHGVFATRSPRRPNPIGLTVVELLGRDGPRLRVRGVDMLDGTPILDVKPYLSSIPSDQLRRGWLDDAEGRRRASE
jgi:tRNA (adenine37-N6)-methyltransferase